MDKPIGKEIGELSRDIRRLLYLYLEEYSLGDGQFGILYDVSREEGISQEKLSRLRNVDKATITKAVKKLIENGYIYRERDEADRRSYRLYCTQKGLDFSPEIDKIIQLEGSVLTRGSSPEEMEIFLKVVRRMKENIRVHIEEEIYEE